VEVGPLVYALESVDLPGGAHVDQFLADTSRDPIVTAGGVFVTGYLEGEYADGWPYGDHPHASTPEEPISAALIPYHAWANRGPGTMRVWMRAAPEHAGAGRLGGEK
jgi:DUF1680 family protein